MYFFIVWKEFIILMVIIGIVVGVVGEGFIVLIVLL